RAEPCAVREERGRGDCYGRARRPLATAGRDGRAGAQGRPEPARGDGLPRERRAAGCSGEQRPPGRGRAHADPRRDGPGPARNAQLYFDSSPLKHPAAWAKLASLGDDSSTYLWRVFAARDIMRLYRRDPAGLRRLQWLQGQKASAEEVLHPPDETLSFADPAAL